MNNIFGEYIYSTCHGLKKRHTCEWVLWAWTEMCQFYQNHNYPTQSNRTRENKVTYWANGSLEKAPRGVRLADGAQQVGYLISESLQCVWSTGEDLILPPQFGLVRNVDVFFLQSNRCEQINVKYFMGLNMNCALKFQPQSRYRVLYLSLSRSSLPLKSAWCLFLISWFNFEQFVSSCASCSFRLDIVFCCFEYSVLPSSPRFTLKRAGITFQLSACVRIEAIFSVLPYLVFALSILSRRRFCSFSNCFSLFRARK